jgi:TIR domain
MDATGRIHDQFDMYFGSEYVFRDIERIHAGTNFPDELKKALDQCDILIAIIGNSWLEKADNDGIRRLDNPNDFVRLEIATALEREIPIIPVLIDNSNMPSAQQLPSVLEKLAFKNAIHIPSARNFSRSVRDLVFEINRLTGLPFEDFPNVVRNCQQTGLVMVKSNFRADNSVLDEMQNSQELLVVMNDGRGWLDQNREIIHQRLRDTSKLTRVVLLHPASPFIDTLIAKNGKTKAAQIEEIQRSYTSLKESAKADSNFDIRGHFGFNAYSLTLSDHYAFISPYYFNERGALPLFKFSSRFDGGIYFDLKIDAEKMFDKASPLTSGDFLQND